jgi:hypothetical protein
MFPIFLKLNTKNILIIVYYKDKSQNYYNCSSLQYPEFLMYDIVIMYSIV